MVDVRILEKHGCTAEKWKAIFEGRERPRPMPKNDPVQKTDKKEDKIDELMERIWSRIRTGRDWNFANYQVIHAMDLIYDAPFRNISPTLIASICEKHGNNTEEIKNALTGLGLNLDSVLFNTSEIDPKTNKPIQAVNVPSFFAVVVPLVRAYLNIRRAKIVNDRNRDPFFEFKPATSNNANRVRCEVLTSRVQASAKAYDYFGTLNQAVLQMFLYPQGCLLFTREEWDKCEQMRLNKEGKEEKYIVREGLRYHAPHPSRLFWDFAYPARSFNTDTGSEYAGYWQLLRYGDVLDNDGFYNKEKVTIGDTGWFNSVPLFWRTVYSSCTVKAPQLVPPTDVPEGADREEWLANNPYYTGLMRDSHLMVCEYRERLIPKDWGLGTYQYPIWARFVVAGDGTIIYAAPMGYRPVTVFRDNGDDKRIGDATLALQLAPYQDQLSNLLTQFLLAAKQNLANLTLIEEGVVKPETIKKILNEGETYFRSLNIQSFSAKDLFRLQLDPRAAIQSHRFPPLDTNGIVLAMKLVIDMAERVLQFSSQEIAQAASHEQTKAEVDKIAATTTNILEYTGSAVDAGMEAMAHQLYEAIMNYGEDEFYAQVPSDHGLSKEKLAALGITQDDDNDETTDKKIKVKAKKSAMTLDSFATVPPTTKRETNWEAAQAMAGLLRDIASNDMLKMAIGPQQMVDIANQIAKLAGLKLPAPLRNVTAETNKEMASDLLKQTVDAVLGVIRPEVKEGLQPVLTNVQDLTNKMQAIYQLLGNAAAPANPPVVPGGSIVPPDMALAAGGAPVPVPAPVPGGIGQI